MHTVGCPRTCLGFTNLFFFILGLVGCAICVWCSVNTEFFTSVNYTITKSSMVPTIADFVNLRLWNVPLTSVLIPIGCIAMLTSCCGVISAGCQMKCALKAYALLLTLLTGVAFWIIFVTFFYNVYTKNESTRLYLKRNLRDLYGQEDDLMTFLLNYVMVHYGCCGVDGPSDFVGSRWHVSHQNQSFPLQCCQLANNTTFDPIYVDCPTGYWSSSYAYKLGCFDTLHGVVRENKGKLAFYAALVATVYSLILLMIYVIFNGVPLIETLNLKPKMLRWRGASDPAVELPSAPPESVAALNNMLFVEEPSQKVVRVVSAVHPGQMFKFADARSVAWGGGSLYGAKRVV